MNRVERAHTPTQEFYIQNVLCSSAAAAMSIKKEKRWQDMYTHREEVKKKLVQVVDPHRTNRQHPSSHRHRRRRRRRREEYI